MNSKGERLRRLADLVRSKNKINNAIAEVIERPALMGHVGEYVTQTVFDIALERSAANKGFDGRFTTGMLAGQAVNVKWYGTHDGLLDLAVGTHPDYYLVLTGPRAAAASSLGGTRPRLISSAFLFENSELLAVLQARGVKVGVATSVIRRLWDEAEIYPNQRSRRLILSTEQREMLALFGEPHRQSKLGTA
jgi:hypothetical protein